MPVKLVVAVLMVVFALFELAPRRAPLALTPRYLPLGGVLSGFFGGLSGHQGALRSAFLIKAGLTKESFIATGVVISVMVDIPRIVMYGVSLPGLHLADNRLLLAAAVLAAFGGAWLGNRLLTKVTLRLVQLLVTLMLSGHCRGPGERPDLREENPMHLLLDFRPKLGWKTRKRTSMTWTSDSGVSTWNPRPGFTPAWREGP